MQKNKGFTLIELMITIAVLAIIATMAAPSFSQMLNRNETVVCTSINKSAIAVTNAECGAVLTNYLTSMTTSLKKDSVLIVNVEKKINLKTTSDDNFVFSARGNLDSSKTITFCSSVGSYILSVGIPGSVDITQGSAC